MNNLINILNYRYAIRFTIVAISFSRRTRHFALRHQSIFSACERVRTHFARTCRTHASVHLTYIRFRLLANVHTYCQTRARAKYHTNTRALILFI